MQRQSQRNLQPFFCQLPNPGYNPAGGYCYISLTDVQPALRGQKLKKLKQRIIIIQRLPCSHNNYVMYPLFGPLLYLIYLIQHFRSCQSPFQSPQSRRTESAAHPAANLGRNTDGITMMIFHQHALNHTSIRQPK